MRNLCLQHFRYQNNVILTALFRQICSSVMPSSSHPCLLGTKSQFLLGFRFQFTALQNYMVFLHSVFSIWNSVFLLYETSKFCLHAGGVILHCVPGWTPEKNRIPSWELDCKETNPFMYVCSCFLISDIASIVKNLGIALFLDFPCISMCQMSSESFFPAVYFSHVLIDHYNNVLIIWDTGVWVLWLQNPIMAFFSMDLKEPFIASLHPQLASFPYSHTTKSKVSKNVWERFKKWVLWEYIWAINVLNFTFFIVTVLQDWSPTAFAEVWT